jgi:chromosome segregation ATPase
MILLIPRAVREFVEAARAIPDQLELIREAMVSYDPQGWRAAARDCEAWQAECDSLREELNAVTLQRDKVLDEHEGLRVKLATETAAHQETKSKLSNLMESKGIMPDQMHVAAVLVNEVEKKLARETDAHEATRTSHGEMRRALGEAERKLDALTPTLESVKALVDYWNGVGRGRVGRAELDQFACRAIDKLRVAFESLEAAEKVGGDD